MTPSRQKTTIIIVCTLLAALIVVGIGIGAWAAFRAAAAAKNKQSFSSPPFQHPVPTATLTATSRVDAAAGVPLSAVLVPKVRAALRRSLRATASMPAPFPIDAVVTWVDGTDTAWKAAAAAWYAREKAVFSHVAHAPAREPEPVQPFTRDELFYNVHLAAAHCPWLRTYYVVAARPQRPWWWPPSGVVGTVRLELVYHDDIAPPDALLPTFNSNAIQSWLANIPGLAEHFILFDDDFFVGQPMEREHFFTTDGRPVLRTYKCNVSQYDVPPQATLWESVCAFTAARIRAASGTSARPHFTEHVAVPVLRSLWHDMVTDWFQADIAQLRRFRSRTDFVLQYVLLGTLFALGELRPLPAHIETVFFLTDRFGMLMARADADGRPPPHLFCINDRMSARDRAAMDMLMNTRVAMRLPQYANT